MRVFIFLIVIILGFSEFAFSKGTNCSNKKSTTGIHFNKKHRNSLKNGSIFDEIDAVNNHSHYSIGINNLSVLTLLKPIAQNCNSQLKFEEIHPSISLSFKHRYPKHNFW